MKSFRNQLEVFIFGKNNVGANRNLRTGMRVKENRAIVKTRLSLCTVEHLVTDLKPLPSNLQLGILSHHFTHA